MKELNAVVLHVAAWIFYFSFFRGSFGYLCRYVVGFVTVCTLIKNVRHEKELEHNEDYYEFDNHDNP